MTQTGVLFRSVATIGFHDLGSGANRYDGRGDQVIVLADGDGRDRIACTSFEEAVRVVKAETGSTRFTKIEDRDGEVVFNSQDMDIENWENEWRRARRRLGMDVEEYDCPYDSVGCLADDLCVQCKMDKVQDKARTE